MPRSGIDAAQAAAGFVATPVMTPHSATAFDRNACCESMVVEIPVTFGGVDGYIMGVLNVPPQATTVQILIHGWTYNHYYWDPPYQPDVYSYTRAANKNGYATLAIDRLGTGCSMKPLSLYNTFTAQVEAAHAAVTALRNGDVGYQFDKVIAVGHSAGSLVASSMAGRHNDVDALITTGYSHRMNALFSFPTLVGRDFLAAGDPKFVSEKLDPLYVSSIPGTRYTFYRFQYTQSPVEGIAGRGDSATGEYRLLNADPQMVAIDEQFMRSTDSLVTLGTALPTEVINDTADLNIPVLSVNGDHEVFFCGAGTVTCTSSDAIADFERQFYGPGATVKGFAVAGTGHDIHLEYTSAEASKVMLEFCDEHVGRGFGVAGSIPAPRPLCTVPEPVTPPLLYRLANQALVALVLPLINTFAWAVDPLPGMGDAVNPLPIVSDFLTQLTRIITDLLGRTSQDCEPVR